MSEPVLDPTFALPRRCGQTVSGVGHYVYAHMCRDGHPTIGHNDSGDDERCPLCRVMDAETSAFQRGQASGYNEVTKEADGLRARVRELESHEHQGGHGDPHADSAQGQRITHQPTRLDDVASDESRSEAGSTPADAHSACQHDLTERETACADGVCPLCQAATIATLRAEVARLRESLRARLARVEEAAKVLGAIQWSDDEMPGIRRALAVLRERARKSS